MKTILCGFVLSFGALAAFAQSDPQDQTAAQQQQQNPDQQNPDQQGRGADRSVLQPKPAGEVIKEKDLYEKTGYWHPFVRMPMYILNDQKAIWTSPFHTSKKDIKYWVIFGAITGGLIAADKHIEKSAPSNSTLVRVGTDASYLGQAYSLLPIAAGFYFIGTSKGSEHLRETGLLSFEAVADATLVAAVLKPVFSRARPLEGNGNGQFWDSGSHWNAGFPSGHSINTFAIASVFAHEYHHHWWAKAIFYGYGAGVAGARLAAKQHFPGDVVAGGVAGWFIGDYVYGKRHNPELEKVSLKDRIFDHVHVGQAVACGGPQPCPAW